MPRTVYNLSGKQYAFKTLHEKLKMLRKDLLYRIECGDRDHEKMQSLMEEYIDIYKSMDILNGYAELKKQDWEGPQND